MVGNPYLFSNIFLCLASFLVLTGFMKLSREEDSEWERRTQTQDGQDEKQRHLCWAEVGSDLPAFLRSILALVEDVNTEKDILGLFGASLPDSDAGTSRLDSFSSPPPSSSLSDSQGGVSMVIWGFKFDWSAGLEERSLVDLETDAAALSAKAFAFASWCCVWAFCSSTAEEKKKKSSGNFIVVHWLVYIVKLFHFCYSGGEAKDSQKSEFKHCTSPQPKMERRQGRKVQF